MANKRNKTAKKKPAKPRKKAASKAPRKILKKKARKAVKKKSPAPKKKTASKAPGKTVKKAAKKAIKKSAPPKPVTRAVAITQVEGKTATITVVFMGVGSGNSLITATLNGVSKSRTSSGDIIFTGVRRDDVIGIDGSSPGSTRVSIDIDATPPEFSFTGNFNDNFIVN